MNNLITIISGIIIVLGIFYFLFSIYRSRKLKGIELAKPKAIEHYEKIRDDLTTREEEEEIEDSSSVESSPFSVLSSFVIAIVSLAVITVIALTIMSQLQTSLDQNSASYNASSALVNAVTDQMPIFPTIMVIVIIIAILGLVIKVVGGLGSTSGI